MAIPDHPHTLPLDGYTLDQVLTLRVRPEHSSKLPPTIQVQVRQLHTRTLSCTMVVDPVGEVQSPNVENTVFLKLFDRRFAEQLRQDNGIEKWTRAMEEAYLDAVKSGAICSFLHDLHEIPKYKDDTEEDWDDAQNEAFLADELHGLYKTEVAVYNALNQYQGRLIPTLLAAVELDIAPAKPDIHPSAQDLEPCKVRGILLQYIPGHSMKHLPDHFPRSSWQDIVDQALLVVNVLGDHSILNRDVRPENFLISKKTEVDISRYQVFMIDFALCRFRGRDESDLEWGRAKHTKDEEGAIALRMKKLLEKEHGFDLQYQDSMRYAKWADTEDNFHHNAVRTELRPGVVVYSLAKPKSTE
ncbi:hypothetical protein FZEAL_7218 [Fusarium zealandicum]|uniref:Protein kinase domain-containing protein n=1 Tax=Fusarium zealandicum TaxID=1053134 RepID=A0A8H4UG69_9HYPO|nr:hypothetical protein FZEAL_7218 [Fusarium zealandicum]